MARYPFTWAQFEREIGRELPADAKTRLTRAITTRGERTWKAARSIVVAPQMSITGQTLWQCVEAVTLSKVPDERTPSENQLIRAMCYAAGLPFPSSVRR